MIIRRLGSFFLELLQVVIFAISIFLFVYLLVLQPHKIKGASMEPNFHDGEYLLTDKVSYRLGQPERGDVIVFKAPPTFKDEFIKRIIGLPGDELMVQQGKVFVNNKELKEVYLDPSSTTRAGSMAVEGKTITVPKDLYFVLGDNRDHSLDSRNIGFINKTDITGRAWFVYWPPSEVGNVTKQIYAF